MTKLHLARCSANAVIIERFVLWEPWIFHSLSKITYVPINRSIFSITLVPQKKVKLPGHNSYRFEYVSSLLSHFAPAETQPLTATTVNQTISTEL
jgi:hypothetical protein